MGVVYAATDLRLKRLVALKVIAPRLAAEPNFQQRFERECELAASIDHPGVIPVYSAGEEEGAAYVTMRFVEGTDLAQMITREGRLPAPRVATVAVQLGDALDAAHARGLVHRDVKPANVLVREGGHGEEVFLTDFGLTRELSSDTRFTATGAVIGTVDYMAPEQFKDAPLDARTDVYALGCVLYESLTGSVPFPTEGAVAKLYAHTSAERPSLLERAPDLPAALDRVVGKAMALKPEDRFQTAGDLGRAAAAAIDGEAAGAQPTAAVGLAGTGGETDGTATLAEGESATTPLPSEPPPTPPAARPPARPAPPDGAPPAPPPQPPRRAHGLAIALGVAVFLVAAAIAYVVFGRDSDESGSGKDRRAAVESGAQENTAVQAPGAGGAAAEVPAGDVAIVKAYKRGDIESEGFERRARLVELRDPGTTRTAAHSQALDELILNRWLRGEAAQQGLDLSAEVDAELASPEFAPEVERLSQVGYLEGGIRLDAEARLAAEALYPGAVPLLTSGLDEGDAGEIAELVDEWRPETACAEGIAELSPLCVNGPEP